MLGHSLSFSLGQALNDRPHTSYSGAVVLCSTLASILEFIGGLADWAYVLIFLAAIAETIPGLGVVIPGQLIVVAGGAAASLGHIDVGDVIVVSTLGAVLGDYFGYVAGRRGGRALLLRFGARLGLKPQHLDKAHDGLSTNPFTAIVLGRFNNLTRAFIPYAAGSVGFPPRKFLAYNLIGGILWGIASTLVGVAFGRSYKIAEAVIGRVLGVVFVLLVGFYLAYRLLRLAHAKIGRAEAAWFVVATIATIGFLLVAEDVEDGDGLTAYDPIAREAASRMATIPALGFLPLISDLGSAIVVTPLIIAAAILVWRSGRRADAVTLGMLAVATQAIVLLVKYVFARARPETAAGLATGYSFPSGHTTTAAFLACALAWFAYRHVRLRYAGVLTLVAATGWVLLMALSRLALGVHYFTDVLAGACLGIAIGGFGLAGPNILPRLRESLLDRLAVARSRAP